MRQASKKDKRIANILTQVNRFSRGEFGQYLSVSDALDEIDAISTGLNHLGEALAIQHDNVLKKEERIRSFLDNLRSNFLGPPQRPSFAGDVDEIEALAEELKVLRKKEIHRIHCQPEDDASLQVIFRNASDAVVFLDRNNIIVRWNPAASRIFGWMEEEVAGKDFRDILFPERIYLQKHPLGTGSFSKAGKDPVLNRAIEMTVLCKNNLEIDVEITISHARLKNDYQSIVFLRDVTQRKKNEGKIQQLRFTLEQLILTRAEQLSSSEKEYQHLFKNNPIPLWVLDVSTHRILDVNESAIKHYGYSREEFLSMSATELRPEDERERYLALNRSLKGTQNRGVWKHRKKDGNIIYCEVIVHEMPLAGRQARLIVANDVTAETRVSAPA